MVVRPHVGHLWSSSGSLLATVTFGNETATGWQRADFSTPVSIAAGTTYVISFSTGGGYFGITDGGFGSSGVSNGPLHALPERSHVGGNGVYGVPGVLPERQRLRDELLGRRALLARERLRPPGRRPTPRPAWGTAAAMVESPSSTPSATTTATAVNADTADAPAVAASIPQRVPQGPGLAWTRRSSGRRSDLG